MNRPTLPRRDGYDEMAYRQALQRLGLFPPIELDDIRRAYRHRAWLIHPDRVAMDKDACRSATERIQELNVARDYAVRHYHWFHLYRYHGREAGAGGTGETNWREWVALPVTAVYALSMVLIAMPFLILTSWLGDARRERYRSSLWFQPALLLWRTWLLLGPHIALITMFTIVEEPIAKAWFGVSLLVMLSADMASLLTGATNSLRSQRAILRLHQLVGR